VSLKTFQSFKKSDINLEKEVGTSVTIGILIIFDSYMSQPINPKEITL
jgi:hypothetical protein